MFGYVFFGSSASSHLLKFIPRSESGHSSGTFKARIQMISHQTPQPTSYLTVFSVAVAVRMGDPYRFSGYARNLGANSGLPSRNCPENQIF